MRRFVSRGEKKQKEISSKESGRIKFGSINLADTGLSCLYPETEVSSFLIHHRIQGPRLLSFRFLRLGHNFRPYSVITNCCESFGHVLPPFPSSSSSCPFSHLFRLLFTRPATRALLSSSVDCSPAVIAFESLLLLFPPTTGIVTRRRC